MLHFLISLNNIWGELLSLKISANTRFCRIVDVYALGTKLSKADLSIPNRVLISNQKFFYLLLNFRCKRRRCNAILNLCVKIIFGLEKNLGSVLNICSGISSILLSNILCGTPSTHTTFPSLNSKGIVRPWNSLLRVVSGVKLWYKTDWLRSFGLIIRFFLY